MKYCRHCGSEMVDEAVVCVKCGVAVGTPVRSPKAYCRNCGVEMNPQAKYCVQCGVKQEQPAGQFGFDNLTRSNDGKIIAGVCSGLGKCWGIDPWILRLLFIFINGIGLAVYIIAACVLPLDE